MTGAWGKAYLKWLAKGCDHGDAAYRADQAEKRSLARIEARSDATPKSGAAEGESRIKLQNPSADTQGNNTNVI